MGILSKFYFYPLDDAFHGLTGRLVYTDVGIAIVRRFAHIDNNEPCSSAFGVHREIGSRIDDEGRADDDQKIAIAGIPGGIAQSLRRQTLAEENDVRLKDTLAVFAGGHIRVSLVSVNYLPQGIAGVTIQAHNPVHAAVKLIDLLGIITRFLMKIIDILGDDGRRLAVPVETRQREMPATRPGAGEMLFHGESPPPCFVAHFLICEEVFEWNRPVLSPQPARRAEIRDTAFGGNARPGEWHHYLGARDQLLESSDACLKVFRDHIFFLVGGQGMASDVLEHLCFAHVFLAEHA